MGSEEIIRVLSGKQLVELKKLFANHEIIHLGIVDSDGRLVCEYEQVIWLTDDAERWHTTPKVELKTVIINR